jgi:hypothetical protein
MFLGATLALASTVELYIALYTVPDVSHKEYKQFHSWRAFKTLVQAPNPSTSFL